MPKFLLDQVDIFTLQFFTKCSQNGTGCYQGGQIWNFNQFFFFKGGVHICKFPKADLKLKCSISCGGNFIWNIDFIGNFLWSFLWKLHFQAFVISGSDLGQVSPITWTVPLHNDSWSLRKYELLIWQSHRNIFIYPSSPHISHWLHNPICLTLTNTKRFVLSPKLHEKNYTNISIHPSWAGLSFSF